MPVARIKSIAETQRMMAAWFSFPGGVDVLAARCPLPRHPPAPDLFRTFGILQIENHDDIADIAFDGRRNIGVSSVKIEPVDTLAGGFPIADMPGIFRVGIIVNSKPAHKPLGLRSRQTFLIISPFPTLTL